MWCISVLVGQKYTWDLEGRSPFLLTSSRKIMGHTWEMQRDSESRLAWSASPGRPPYPYANHIFKLN